jgi:hypothetical protein
MCSPKRNNLFCPQQFNRYLQRVIFLKRKLMHSYVKEAKYGPTNVQLFRIQHYTLFFKVHKALPVVGMVIRSSICRHGDSKRTYTRRTKHMSYSFLATSQTFTHTGILLYYNFYFIFARNLLLTDSILHVQIARFVCYNLEV